MEAGDTGPDASLLAKHRRHSFSPAGNASSRFTIARGWHGRPRLPTARGRVPSAGRRSRQKPSPGRHANFFAPTHLFAARTRVWKGHFSCSGTVKDRRLPARAQAGGFVRCAERMNHSDKHQRGFAAVWTNWKNGCRQRRVFHVLILLGVRPL